MSNRRLRVQAASVEVEVVVGEEHPREVMVGTAVGLTLSTDTDVSSQTIRAQEERRLSFLRPQWSESDMSCDKGGTRGGATRVLPAEASGHTLVRPNISWYKLLTTSEFKSFKAPKKKTITKIG